ncbi:YggS family pyridoxal phosphate-dependent enzyme [Magnetospirillum sulfuroxidans]|uniref:Pyridoxal phosphate homeostasis protein n=1 Tax=Magnetospirillum sulfuroxidans TaxID=611300 RepID=A0ABS5IEB8_9PROT|nr:YggS family pyridoxal phosphate-dependent enzyme [Magnetospirillum sulfuroxidans]MBR9972759.1 YggS family pyridoxal phosphate-dependent enzyme [Magnetospirillum sulfuroxidans]
MSEAAQNIAALRAVMVAAEQAAGRPAGAVNLVAVSKTHDAETIRPFLQAGLRVFGENRVQEAKGKWPELKQEFPDSELHLIGPLQTNKVREAVALFDVIETIDRPKLARAVAEEIARCGRAPRCLVQVNVGREGQKAGIDPDQAVALVELCRREYALPVTGLMCIPPAEGDPAPYFRLLADLAHKLGLSDISMGMSGDFPTAIACGATHVRVGSALFGRRDNH